MIVILRHFGFLGIAFIFWFPVLYVIFLIRCFIRGISRSRNMYRRDDGYDFVMDVHNKLGWGIFIIWAMILSNAEQGTTAYAVCGAIYVICVILSFLPFHRIFITKKS